MDTEGGSFQGIERECGDPIKQLDGNAPLGPPDTGFPFLNSFSQDEARPGINFLKFPHSAGKIR